MIRMTNAMLEAIVYMAGTIEAGGDLDMQGFDGPDHQARATRMYGACLAARDWADAKLAEREGRRRRRKGKG